MAMTEEKQGDRLVGILKDTVVALVSAEERDLTHRQTAVLLTCYLDEHAHTVRGLARELNISKPAVTRAIDKLEGLDLLARADDPSDRRSILLECTNAGRKYMARIRSLMTAAARSEGCDKLQHDVSAVSYATSELILELS
jgi:DNA-binding MarR family transcriptional regulator